MSLIFPYNVVTARQRDEILKNVEYLLLRKRGIIRYKNDHYYNRNPDGYSEEAEWTFGLSWLAIIYEQMGKMAKARKFVKTGVKEIFLLGQNVNSYGKKEELCSFHELLSRVNNIEGLLRIRFTTSHPKDLTEDLMRAFAT